MPAATPLEVFRCKHAGDPVSLAQARDHFGGEGPTDLMRGVPGVVSPRFIGKKLEGIRSKTSNNLWTTRQELCGEFLEHDTRRERNRFRARVCQLSAVFGNTWRVAKTSWLSKMP